MDEKRELKQAFLDEWPLERVRNMSLEEYTNLNREGSFCYWVERKTQDVGSIQGVSSFKFGIYKPKNSDKEYESDRYMTDGNYSWLSKYGDTAQEAFEKVKELVISTVTSAQENNLEAIDGINLQNMFKWKIAFLYSDFNVISIFKRSAIYEVAGLRGLDDAYQHKISELHEYLMSQKPEDKSYFEYTDELWDEYQRELEKVEAGEKNSEHSSPERNYWLYAPGRNAEYWDQFYESGIMAIGWDFLGDLSEYDSEESLQKELQDYHDTDSSKKNDKKACWEFVSELKEGDVVIAKRGLTEYLGWGIVDSEYIYDEERDTFKNVRKVDWRRKGVWEDEGIVRKALTNISKYPEYVERLKQELSIFRNGKATTFKSEHPLNQILFGPPGTGKTYHTVDHALRIVDPKFYEKHQSNRKKITDHFRKLLITDWDNPKQGRIAATTFHQSFTYEDFIEGIKPVLTTGEKEREEDQATEGESNDESKKEDQLRYTIEDGIFKRISERARQDSGGVIQRTKSQVRIDRDRYSETEFHKISLGNINVPDDQAIYQYCIDNGKVAIGLMNETNFSDEDESEIRNLYKGNPEIDKNQCNTIANFTHGLRKGDYVIVSNGKNKFRAIGRVTGGYEYNPDTPIRYNHFHDVQWLVKDVELPVDLIYKYSFKQQTIYNLSRPDVKAEFFIPTGDVVKGKRPYVLIIDEINRGNIAQIFGELITLIEEDKREGMDEELEVSLPYSKNSFSVPSNLYIIGTMNTADRSVEALDSALRRRFRFREEPPQPSVIAEEGKNKDGKITVNGMNVNLPKLLSTINDRIEKILDKDHLIGHSYFMKVKDCADLQQAFQQEIIPLLEEYFYGDKGKIQLVLSKGFVSRDNDQSADNLFPDNDYEDQDIVGSRVVWQIAEDWKTNEEAFAHALKSLSIHE